MKAKEEDLARIGLDDKKVRRCFMFVVLAVNWASSHAAAYQKHAGGHVGIASSCICAGEGA